MLIINYETNSLLSSASHGPLFLQACRSVSRPEEVQVSSGVGRIGESSAVQELRGNISNRPGHSRLLQFMHCCLSRGISVCLSHVRLATWLVYIDFGTPTHLHPVLEGSIIGSPSVCYTPLTVPQPPANSCIVAWPKWVPILSWITGWINVAGWVSGTTWKLPS